MKIVGAGHDGRPLIAVSSLLTSSQLLISPNTFQFQVALN